MKRTVAAVILTCLFFGKDALAQLSPVQQKAIVVKRMVERNHYAPRAVNDSFSMAVFKMVINAADPRRLLFTSADYQQLAAFSTKLDDELRGEAGNFFDKFSLLYKNALTRADSIVNKVLQKPFDFSAAETLISSRKKDSFAFSADMAALTNRWSRYLKYVILHEVYDAANADSVKKIPFKTGLTTLEPAIREKIKKAELKALKRILDYPAGYPAYVTELYLNAIAGCFDPHTNYFSPQGKEEFQAELSTEAFFFGIVFEENEAGKIVIDKLTPGGPAWKSGGINKGDELISLHWEGKEVQDMTGASLEEVFEVMDQSIHDKLLFRFRKADGTMSMVFLRKEKSSKEDDIVKSFVLKGEKKIGYILLPGFYTEWENEKGSSCANDVAREIVKLKRENIEGLILDVRYNGGGSIGEALDMIGIFIEEGPLSAEKSKDGKLVTLKDPNRGTIYDGPMVLMVNGQSASASEMLAASLQDYNRALIVGSNTYGKATMQEMFPVDTMSSREITGNERGDIIKITTGKLYRVNGQTAQLIGVKPDVVLPDAFDGLEMGERFEKYPLIADTVKRNNYYKPLPYLPVAELAGRSKGRIAANPDFQVIKKIVDEQQRIMQTSTRTIPLKTELFEKWVQQQQLDLEAMKGEGGPTNKFTVENHARDKELMQDDIYAKEMNATWLKNLADDIYIQEVFLVLTDLINLQKPATKNQ
ncbi:MAG TPA: carboxy terminal-processing peptidase [Chitinophagaceae bacterium]|jgi:carboxyl-terminal processing protease|nr:carboxy terminal-processing peptidase [Chitinophagaceae bacterium]